MRPLTESGYSICKFHISAFIQACTFWYKLHFCIFRFASRHEFDAKTAFEAPFLPKISRNLDYSTKIYRFSTIPRYYFLLPIVPFKELIRYLFNLSKWYSLCYTRTTDTRWVNINFLAAQIQIPIPNRYLALGFWGLVFCKNNGWF